MRALLIILPILLFILILLFARLRLLLCYEGGLCLSLSYLFLRFRLYPRKRRRKKKKRKKGKIAQRMAASHEKKGHAKQEKGVSRPKGGGKKKPLSLGDIRFLLVVLREVLASLLERSSRHVRIRIRRLTLSIGGSEDAAKAAIEYGLAAQAVAYLTAFLANTGFLKEPRRGAIDLRVNFLEKQHAFSVRTEIACPLIYLIPLAISALMQALSAKRRWTHRRGGGAKPKNTETNAKKEKNNG